MFGRLPFSSFNAGDCTVYRGQLGCAVPDGLKAMELALDEPRLQSLSFLH